MDLRHISFRLLEVFMSVVKTGSISETARRLHLNGIATNKAITRSRRRAITLYTTAKVTRDRCRA